MSNNNKINYSVFFIKIILSFFVVCIHVNPFYSLTKSDFGFVLNIFFRHIFDLAVPCFFAISGWLYSVKNNDESSLTFYDYLYLFRILKIWMFYFIFYLAIKDFVNFLFSWNLSLTHFFDYYHNFIVSPLKSLINGPYYHLWFIPSLLCSAFIVIFFGKKNFLLPFLISFFIYFVGILGSVHFVLNNRMQIPEHGIFMGPFLFFIGYKFNMLIVCNINYMYFFIISFFIIFLNTIYIDSFDWSLWISYIIFSIGVLNYLIIDKIRYSFLLNKIGNISLGVYVFHPFVILLYGKIINIFDLQFESYIKVFLVYFFTLMICLFLKKNAFMKNYV